MERFNLILNIVQRKALFALLGSVLLWPLAAYAGEENSPMESAMPDIQSVIDATIRQEYELAFDICSQLQSHYPEHPVGYFFEAATLQARMLDYEDYSEKDRFFALTAKVHEMSKKALKSDPQNGWYYFFIGGALGYQAYFLGREQHYLKAFNEGWNSIQSLESTIELDENNFDAYLGIGTYRYYRSKLSKYLSWLPFVGDEKQAGIDMIRQAIEKGKFSHAAAMNALIWIYIGEERYGDAEALIEAALADYPNSRFFLWGKATAASEQEKWQDAEQVYLNILQSYKDEGKRSYYNELLCNARLAQIYTHSGKTELAQNHAKAALQVKIEKSLRKRAQKFQKMAEKIIKEHEEQTELP